MSTHKTDNRKGYIINIDINSRNNPYGDTPYKFMVNEYDNYKMKQGYHPYLYVLIALSVYTGSKGIVIVANDDLGFVSIPISKISDKIKVHSYVNDIHKYRLLIENMKQNDVNNIVTEEYYSRYPELDNYYENKTDKISLIYLKNSLVNVSKLISKTLKIIKKHNPVLIIRFDTIKSDAVIFPYLWKIGYYKIIYLYNSHYMILHKTSQKYRDIESYDVYPKKKHKFLRSESKFKFYNIKKIDYTVNSKLKYEKKEFKKYMNETMINIEDIYTQFDKLNKIYLIITLFGIKVDSYVYINPYTEIDIYKNKLNYYGIFPKDGLVITNDIYKHKKNVRYRLENYNLYNINTILDKYNVPKDVDMLLYSDFLQNYYVLKKILSKYNPKLLFVPYNTTFGLEDKIVPYEVNSIHPGTCYYGASMNVFYNLLKKRYSLITAYHNYTNMIYVRNDIVGKCKKIININNLEKIYEHIKLNEKNRFKYDLVSISDKKKLVFFTKEKADSHYNHLLLKNQNKNKNSRIVIPEVKRMLYTVVNAFEEVEFKKYSNKIYSQNDEDGIINAIFKIIGVTNKYYVEFGTEDGSETNTRNLFEHFGWKGLSMDGSHEYNYINLKKEFITKENILSLFSKYEVPNKFDLLSIDIDGNDIYVWIEIMKKYNPRVVIIEYAPAFGYEYNKIPVYKADYVWNKMNQLFGIGYSGASINMLYKVGEILGYDLVYVNLVNLFFIKKSILKKIKYKLKDVNNYEKLYNNIHKKYLTKIKRYGIKRHHILDREHISFEKFRSDYL